MYTKTTKRDYKRMYMRDIRGKPWLNDFESAALSRGLSLKQAIDHVLSEIARKRMIGGLLSNANGQAAPTSER